MAALLCSDAIELKSDKEIGVCNFEIIAEFNQVFIVESSKQLLNRLVTPIAGDLVCWSIDGVYKIATGHTVILMRAVDWNGAALPCAFAVVPTESTESYEFVGKSLSRSFPRLLRNSPQLTRFIMADNHRAIAAGLGHTPRGNEQDELEHARFETSFLSCWFHQKQDLERVLPSKLVTREHREEIVNDIRLLHQIPYAFEHLFDMALRAFHRHVPSVVGHQLSLGSTNVQRIRLFDGCAHKSWSSCVCLFLKISKSSARSRGAPFLSTWRDEYSEHIAVFT